MNFYQAVAKIESCQSIGEILKILKCLSEEDFSESEWQQIQHISKSICDEFVQSYG